MRKVIYGAACSLDGFIGTPDGNMDWLHWSKDVHDYMAAFWPRVDAMIMGRKTWEVANAMGGGGEEISRELAHVSSYVFSRTLESIPKGAQLVKEDAGDFVRAMKRKPGRDICVFGGGEFAGSLFRAGVIDEVGLNIQPVLLGSGIPFFRDTGRNKLKLIENRTIDGGCILATYQVLAARPAKQRAGRKASEEAGLAR
jgi:dihydrofolate reductase